MTKPLEKYTVPELKALAKEQGFTGYYKLRKDELLSLLRKDKKPSGEFLTTGYKKPSEKGKCLLVKCSDSKVCNPKSGRCVNKSGKIGQALLGGGKKTKPAKPADTKPAKPADTKPADKKCREDKILNPKTNRCVNKSGKIGQALLVGVKPVGGKIHNGRTLKWTLYKNVEWFIFTKSGCEYCKKAKDILRKHKKRFTSQEITEKNSSEIFAEIDKKTNNYRYFPVVFHNGKFFGGFKELEDKLDSIPMVSNIHIMEPIYKSKIDFQGTPWHEMVAMLYLTWKYPKECVTIPKYITSGGKLTTQAQQVRAWIDTSLTWVEKHTTFEIPNGLWVAVHNCLTKGSRFIVIPFGFSCLSGGHANFLVYDSKTKEMERFEPNGSMDGECYTHPEMDAKIKRLFNENVKKDMVKKMYTPLEFCPRVNFQRIQHKEGEKKIGDPAGFCAAWAAWYADTRLSNPNKTRKQVIDMALKKLNDDPESFTSFIRSYAGFIEDAGKKLKKSKDPHKVFQKMVQKYT